MTYYTLRKAGDPAKPTYELAKWEDDRVHPLDVYVQWIPQRGDGSYNVHSCNCPSRSNPCKHAEMSETMLNQLKDPTHLEYAYWEDGEMRNTNDMPNARFFALMAHHFDP